ncbi:MAG: hypothetical protein AAFR61_29390 [Bacteroidota bacterium]
MDKKYSYLQKSIPVVPRTVNKTKVQQQNNGAEEALEAESLAAEDFLPNWLNEEKKIKGWRKIRQSLGWNQNNYHRYNLLNERARFIELARYFQTFAATDPKRAKGLGIADLLKKAKAGLEQENPNNLLEISTTLDLVDRYMVWLYPQNNLNVFARRLELDLKAENHHFSTVVSNALNTGSADDEDKRELLASTLDEYKALANKEALFDKISAGLQLQRLQMLRRFGLAILVLFLATATFFSRYNATMWEDSVFYQVTQSAAAAPAEAMAAADPIIRGENSPAEATPTEDPAASPAVSPETDTTEEAEAEAVAVEPAAQPAAATRSASLAVPDPTQQAPKKKSWLSEGDYSLALLPLGLMLIGGFGGFFSGLLQIRSTKVGLLEYQESRLKFQLKPILGGILAMLVFLMLSWDVLPGIRIESAGTFIVLAFAAGFSERYVLNLLKIDGDVPEPAGDSAKVITRNGPTATEGNG